MASNPFDQFDTANPFDQFDGDAARQQSAANIAADEQSYSPLSGMTALDRFWAGAGKSVTDIGRGAGQLLGLVSNDDVAEARRLDAPLMSTKAGKAGNFAGAVAAAVPAAFIPGANTVAGAGAIGAGLGLLQPATSAQERITNTALGGALGAGGQKLGQTIAAKAGERIASKNASAAARKSANAVTDDTLREARALGYVVPPTHANPTATNAVIESIGGKAQTQQTMAVRNQRLTDQLVRKELGLGKDSPLSKSVLEGVRERAGRAYESVAQSGDIVTDGQYLDELAALTRDADTINADFPDLRVGGADEIQELQNGLLKDKFNARSAVELVKKLRKEASADFRTGADALARAKKEAAGIVEDMISRHLGQAGKGALVRQFENARVLIAKAHSVEDALVEGTGHINAAKLAGELRKGKPLSGNLATIAKFAQAFPKAAAHPQSSAGVSAVDAIVAGGLGATLDPTFLALPLGRMAARRAMASGAYQNALGTPAYTPSTGLLRFAEQVGPMGSLPLTNALLPAE